MNMVNMVYDAKSLFCEFNRVCLFIVIGVYFTLIPFKVLAMDDALRAPMPFVSATRTPAISAQNTAPLSTELAEECDSVGGNNESVLQRTLFDVQNNDGNTPLHIALGAVSSTIEEDDDDVQIPLNDSKASPSDDRVQYFMVQQLLACGANPNIKNKKELTPLHLAVGIASVPLARELLMNGALVTATDEQGNTPLHCACAAQMVNEQLVMDLLEPACGADPEQKNKAGMIAQELVMRGKGPSAPLDKAFKRLRMAKLLYTAVNNDKATVLSVRRLLRDGAETDYTDNESCVSLYCAAFRGKTAITQELLNAGATLYVVNAKGQSPLHAAAVGGHKGVMDLLLKKAEELAKKDKNFSRAEFVNQKDNEDQAPIHCAVYAKQSGTLRQLLAAGADPVLEGKAGALPLHVAALQGDVEIIQLLLADKRVVDTINSRAYKGMTSLAAALYYKHQAAAITLLNAGADPLVADDENFTTLNCAVVNDDAVMVRMLIDAVAKKRGDVHKFVMARDTVLQATALHSAASMGLIMCASVLLEHGADANAHNRAKVTPLHIAARTGDAGRSMLVHVLLSYKADPNAMSAIEQPKNEPNGTPLHWAAQHGQVETVKALLSAGADQTIKNADGDTALAVARKHKQIYAHAALFESLAATNPELFEALVKGSGEQESQE